MKRTSSRAVAVAVFAVLALTPAAAPAAASAPKPPGLEDLIKCGYDDGAWRCDIPPQAA